MTPSDPMSCLPAHDLHCAAMQVGTQWREVADRRILITGGTGFVGRWLVETLAHARASHHLACELSLVTRSATRTRERWPWLASQLWISLLEADVREIPMSQGSIDVVLHGAADTAIAVGTCDVAEVCELGTRRMLELAERCGASRFHLVSSGAVYAPRQAGDPDPTESEPIDQATQAPYGAYALGKQAAERLVSKASNGCNAAVTVSRVFGLIGPSLPLDGRFAIGNFIRDALHGGPILVRGDGQSVRSYLHGADLAAWIWTLTLAGARGTVLNAGSDEAISIADLAGRVRDLLAPRCSVRIEAASGVDRSRYVPDASRAGELLGLRRHRTLDQGILGTARHYQGTVGTP